MGYKKYGVILGLLFCVPVWAQFLPEENVSFEVENEMFITPTKKSIQIAYTWADFLEGKTCQDDFNRLNALDFLSKEEQLLKDKMQIYCTTSKRNTVWSNLLVTFRQCKKNLLINKTLKENGIIWGYIKSVPYFLFDVHNARPNKNTLKGKLDLIQNAIQNKKPEHVLFEMQGLSPEEQLYLTAVFNEADSLEDFKNVLQGGRND